MTDESREIDRVREVSDALSAQLEGVGFAIVFWDSSTEYVKALHMSTNIELAQVDSRLFLAEMFTRAAQRTREGEP